MIPPVCSSSTLSPGERELFERFAEDDGTGDWVVLHSYDLPKHATQVSGEIDFVVLVPGMGVVALEVKAHETVHRTRGMWKLGGKEEARGPFKQAADACHSLRTRALEGVAAAAGVPFYSAVCFTEVSFDDGSPEWHPWQVIDRTTLESRGLTGPVLGVLRGAREHLTEATNWFDPRSAEPTPETIDQLVRHLRGDFECHQSPKARHRRLMDEVHRYSVEQTKVLDALVDNDRVLIDGPAGTGKTVIALEAARRASLEGQRVLLACFNTRLAKHLEEQVDATTDITVRTVHNHMLDIVGRPSVDGRPDSFWTQELPEAAAEALLERERQDFDVLVLDEAQDLTRLGYLDVLSLDLVDGLDGGRWLMVGDTANQTLYGDDEDLRAHLTTLGASHVTYGLTVNCRNTPRVADLASMLGGLRRGYTSTRRPDDGVEPDTRVVPTDGSTAAELVRTLDTFASDGYRPQDIVVLSPRWDCAASRVDTERWAGRIGRIDGDTRGKVTYSTIHQFKGLEAPVIIVTDIADLADDAARRLLYVAVTRALRRVAVIVERRAAADLASLLIGA